MLYKERWIQFVEIVDGEPTFAVFSRRGSPTIVGYTFTVRAAIDLIDELAQQGELPLSKNHQLREAS